MPANTKSEARRRATEIVDRWAAGVLSTSWVPAGSFLAAGADQVMIGQVAECFGVRSFDKKSVMAHAGAGVGAGLAGGAVSEVMSLVPVVGWAAKAIFLASKAKLIGEYVIGYFEDNCSLPN